MRQVSRSRDAIAQTCLGNELHELLEFAVEAHGGLERWRRAISITARLSIGGLVLANSGWESALDNIAIRMDTRDQHAVLSPFTGIDRRGRFTPDRVAIEAYVPGLRRTGLAQRGRCAADAGRALNAPVPGRPGAGR